MRIGVLLSTVWILPAAVRAGEPFPLPAADGFRGIWYMNQPTKDEYGYKYSGGMATYPQQHIPIAVHSPAAEKTFFVFGGTTIPANAPGKPSLLHGIAFFDHKTKTVSRPRILLDKKTDDAHDNPTLSIDDTGHLWVFSSAHGTSRPSFLHRSVKPYDIESFEKVWETNFSYPQPWHLPGRGFLFLHTRYKDGRGLSWTTSPDGRTWADPVPLAKIEMGDYQVSGRYGRRIGTAFDFHPRPGGLNSRTNVYYLQTDDGGRTWTTAAGTPVKLPLTEPANPALVHDYRAEKKLVYLKDLAFDPDGRPVLLYLTADSFDPGPKGGVRRWFTARWTGTEWERRPVTTSDHNYDHGSLYVEPDRWRVIAPTDPGPQPHGTGGEMVLWESRDRGQTWVRSKVLTSGSPRNHTYARKPVDAHPDFYSLWADGNPLKASESHLYFCRSDGTVFRLPPAMTTDRATPEPLGSR